MDTEMLPESEVLSEGSEEEQPAKAKEQYPHPFHWHAEEYYSDEYKETPRTWIELKMCELSATIREKPNWWTKMRDPEIRAKWKSEIHEQQQDLPVDQQLTEKMVEYVLGELEGYNSLRDEDTGIEAGSVERVWKSDSLIPPELLEELIAAVKPLEDVPANEKDWHPGSNGQVLDLVHPSLYPIIYNRTIWDNPEEPGPKPVTVLVAEEGDTRFCLSQKFQWLPSEFWVDEDGDVELISSYINNLHPEKHAALYPVLENILGCILPLFELVLSDLRRPSIPWRMKSVKFEVGKDSDGEPVEMDAAECIWKASGGEPPYSEDDEDIWTTNESIHAWYAKQNRYLPEVKSPYAGDLDVVRRTVSLSESRIQVIVKLANIVLTPDNPEYSGGVWHVEGMENERIVASSIYYYDSENISESHLAFKQATVPPMDHANGDFYCINLLYRLSPYDKCQQEIGQQLTKKGRCIAFPNIYQHKVAPFKLEDPTKPGYRKILVFFLVDPDMPTYSATYIPPQQREWIREAMHGGLWDKLPVELLDHILNLSAVLTRKEADEYRDELMSERKVFVNEHDSQYFGQMFNMCEH